MIDKQRVYKWIITEVKLEKTLIGDRQKGWDSIGEIKAY